MDKKYLMHIGCFQPSRYLMSRDSEVKSFGTYQECIDSLNSSAKFWNTIGYQVWICTIKKDGNLIASWPNIPTEEPVC